MRGPSVTPFRTISAIVATSLSALDPKRTKMVVGRTTSFCPLSGCQHAIRLAQSSDLTHMSNANRNRGTVKSVPVPFMQAWLLVALIALSCAAYQWPSWFGGVVDPFLATKGILPQLITVTMFAVGLTLRIDEVRTVFANWTSVLQGTLTQYAAMPLLAFLIARLLFANDHDTMMGLIMAGSVPGAMASNVLTLLAGGNTSYSVCLTTMATLLSPLLVPIALRLALGEAIARDVLVASSIQLSWMVVLPVIAGHVVGMRLANWELLLRRLGVGVANASILWIIAVVVAANRAQLSHMSIRVVGAVLLLNLAGYVVGYAAGVRLGIDEKMRRALTLEIGMQNAGLGATLVLSLFPDREAMAIPTALYTFVCMLTGTLLALIWSRSHGARTDLTA